MHAALVSVTIDPASAEAAQAMLQDVIVPSVKASPGFIAGYWMEPENGRAAGVVVFDTEANARAAAPPVGPAPAPGVVVESVDFRVVAASA